MQGGPVDELLDVAVERPVLDQLLLGARGQHARERPIGLGPEDHPLLLAVRGEAVLEELGALLAPVAAPVAAADGAEAVEAGKDVERVGSGHGALLEWLIVLRRDREPRRNSSPL